MLRASRALRAAAAAAGATPATTAPRRLIVDTDGGIDDVQALLMALAHPGARVEAVTTVFGNVSLDVATRNAALVLQALGADVPLLAGAAGPFDEAREPAFAEYAHGADGMGGGSAVAAELAAASGAPAPAPRPLGSFLADAALAAPGELELVLLGPMTNLAHAVAAEPRAARAFKRVVAVGGSLWARGNVGPAAEFNVFADPEAAALVLAAVPNVELVTWDVILDAAMPWAFLDEYLAHDSPAGRIAAAVTPHMAELCRPGGPFRNEGYPFGDPLGMAVALDAPRVVTGSLRRAAAVECRGELTRGMTVVEHRDVSKVPPGPARDAMIDGPLVTFVTDVDRGRVGELLMASVAGGGVESPAGGSS